MLKWKFGFVPVLLYHVSFILTYLEYEKQQNFPPGSRSRSTMFALIVKMRQFRIAIALLERHVYGMGGFPQSLPVPGLEVVI